MSGTGSGYATLLTPFVCRLSNGVFVSVTRISVRCDRKMVMTSISWTVHCCIGTLFVVPSTTALVVGPDGNWLV